MKHLQRNKLFTIALVIFTIASIVPSHARRAKTEKLDGVVEPKPVTSES